MMTKENKLLTPEEVAEDLNVSPMTVRNWLRGGEIKGIKLAGNLWRVKPEDLQKFIDEAEVIANLEIGKAKRNNEKNK